MTRGAMIKRVGIGALALVLLAGTPVLGQLLNEDLNSANGNVTISAIDGFVVDNILGVEVASRSFVSWGWPVMEVTFAPVDVSGGGAVLDLYARYRQVDNPDAEPVRPAYQDAQIWLLIYDADGTELDLKWSTDPLTSLGHWTADEWRHETRDIDALYADAGAPADFDLTQVSKLVVRSTNWRGIQGEDFQHFANLTITPEPATLFLLGLGGLLLRRRRA